MGLSHTVKLQCTRATDRRQRDAHITTILVSLHDVVKIKQNQLCRTRRHTLSRIRPCSSTCFLGLPMAGDIRAPLDGRFQPLVVPKLTTSGLYVAAVLDLITETNRRMDKHFRCYFWNEQWLRCTEIKQIKNMYNNGNNKVNKTVLLMRVYFIGGQMHTSETITSEKIIRRSTSLQWKLVTLQR